MSNRTPKTQQIKKLPPVKVASQNTSRSVTKNPISISNGISNSKQKTNLNSTIILIADEKYDEKKIKELIQNNNILSKEIEELKGKNSEKDSAISKLNAAMNELQQNYDKVKSVLNQKMNSADDQQPLIRQESLHREKKKVIYGESFSPSSIEMKIHEKPESAMRLINEAIKNCHDDFLKKLEPMQIKQICQCMYAKTVKENVYIIKEGEAGDHMYVIASGTMEVTKEGKKLRDMNPGELFGELAVLQNCSRTASVKAVTEASLWTIERKVYQAILQKSNLQQSEKYKTFLKSVNLLKNLSNEEMVKIADALMPEEYTMGEIIVQEGENGQTFYIIKNGEVKVMKKNKENEEPGEVRKLKTGDYFGEKALLNNEIRTATVIANSEKVEVLFLDREDFIRLIGQNRELNTKDYGDEQRNIQQSNVSQIEPVKKEENSKNSYKSIQLTDLEIIKTLGVGGFGKVELVKLKSNQSMVFALKSLSKQHIVEMKQEQHIFSERNILLELKFPFICQLYRTYRDNKYVYLLMEVCLGGEVWTILRNKTSFDDRTTKFVLGCVVLAIKYIHSVGIIYRDLKPENLVFDNHGYVKLCDFGFAKSIGIGRKTFTFCGTPEYVAPEIILNKGHDYASDIWALGILMFELLTGSPPFQGDEPMSVYNQILKGIEKIEFNRKFNRIAVQFIKQVCKDNPTERLGYGKSGMNDITNHKYFSGIDWDALSKRKIIPPIIPRLESNTDTRYFDQFPESNYIPIDETSGWDIGFEF